MPHSRKTIRLQGFDYASPTAYFITVCVRDFMPFFGRVEDGICRLSAIGDETERCLKLIPDLHHGVLLDEAVVMPNHLHMLLQLTRFSDGHRPNAFGRTVSHSVSSIVNQFKGAVTRWYHVNEVFFKWQSRFYDHVVRDDREYWAIKNYIINNPRNWPEDRFFYRDKPTA